MIEFLRELVQLFSTQGFEPHGHCFLWSQPLLMLYVVSDFVIGLSYYSIPLALIYFVRKRTDVAFKWVFWMFSLFILGCGTTHFMDVWTIWNPDYWLDVSIRAVTAGASVATAILLWPLLPKALAIPSPEQLRRTNEQLEDEVRERKRAEEALAQRARELDAANTKLKQSEQLKDEFLANVSHELRTPLTLILAPLESLLSNGASMSEEVKQTLETMHNNAVRLLQMITGLLEFSRLEAGKLKVERTATQIVGLTRAMVADFRPVMHQKALESHVEANVDEAYVLIDRYLYERILFNLLSNAVKFTPSGGRIEITLRLVGDRLRLSVSDTGVGIAESELEMLFQKFRQVEGSATRRFDGVGLGLTLVKEFATLLDGTVSVSSTEGEGSTFTVECRAPRTPEVPGDATESEPVPRLSLVPRTGGAVTATAPDEPEPHDEHRPKVLIAEDNTELAAYVARLLAKTCRTKISADGDSAWELVQEWKPDLALVDVMMPGRDGFSLCRAIKTNRTTASTPVVLLTALTHREALLKGWEAGADEYLIKPFHPTELVTRVRTLLSAREHRRRARRRLRERNAQLHAANRELEAFSYSVSHDLRAPLRAIDGFSRILLTSHAENLPAEAQDYLQRVRTNVQEMSQLIDDLLAFSRLTRQSLKKQRVDPENLVQQALDELRAQRAGRNVEVRVGALPPCDADPALLKQVYVNLLSNALKYTQTREQAQIEVGSRAENGDLVYFVKDNGIGFDMQFADKVFEVFQRLHRNEYEGTGVGLATVQRIVHRHGGRVWAEAHVDRGATFYFTLPRDGS